MANWLLPIGLILLFVAIAFIAIGSIASSGKAETKVAVGGVIGFIPFGFANDNYCSAVCVFYINEILLEIELSDKNPVLFLALYLGKYSFYDCFLWVWHQLYSFLQVIK
jgi:uncharacterized membrane protein